MPTSGITEPISPWDGVSIYYSDGSIVSGTVSEWSSWASDGVQIIRLFTGKYGIFLRNYDYYAIWKEDDVLVGVQAGPSSVYGNSQIIRLNPDGTTDVTDQDYEDFSQDLLDNLNQNLKNGLEIDYDIYVAITDQAVADAIGDP